MLRLGVTHSGILRNYTSHAVNFQEVSVRYKFLVHQWQSVLSTSQYHSFPVYHLSSNQPHLLLANPFRKFQSTRAVAVDPKPGVLKRVLKKLGWLDHSRARLKRSGYYLYESVADKINYNKFFEGFRLEDTFFSWFLITELHVWMLLVRVMAEGEEGRFVRNCIVEAMWEDVSTRAKKLGAANPSSVKSQLAELSEQFQAAIVGYDEGLQTDDKVLAGAIWRIFFQEKCDNPEEVECLVKYIRRQVKVLDELPRGNILLKPEITWPQLETNVSGIK